MLLELDRRKRSFKFLLLLTQYVAGTSMHEPGRS